MPTPLSPGSRGKIVGLYEDSPHNLSLQEVAKATGRPKSTVQSVIKHYRDHGTVNDLPRSGRPPILGERDQNVLIRSIRKDPKLKLDHFAAETGVSPRTVSRIADQHGIHSRICRRKPMISEVNRSKRVQWAKDNEHTDWRTIMFTDESAFMVGETGIERVLRKAGEEYFAKHTSVKFRHGVQVHVWGAILHGHKLPLVRFDLAKARQVNKVKIRAETINSEVYAGQILSGPLQDYVVRAREWSVDVRVVEDGASVHCKGPAKSIRDLCDIPNHPHPPSSPDLNAIEGCWGMVKHKLRAVAPRPTSADGL
jgi:transposase